MIRLAHDSRSAMLAVAAALLLCACSAEPAPTSITESRFVESESATPPPAAAAWKRQALPDEWAASRPGHSGYGWYRLEIASVPPGPNDAALYLTQSLSNAQLFVNGTLAGQSGDLRGTPPQRWEAVQLFAVPRALLREGTNTLDLRVYVPPGERGGIGRALVGPYEPLYLRALRDQFAYAIGPSVASLAMFSLGVFMLVLWTRNRDDRDFLLFAVASMLWGLHTAGSLLPREPLPPPHYEIAWNAMYVFWVILLCVFCVRFARARWPLYERGAFIFATSTVPVLYIAAALGIVASAAATLRLGAIVAALGALYAIVRNAVRTRDTLSWILLATGAAAAAFGIHDWLAAQRDDELRPLYLVPYVSVAFFVLVGWILVERFVRTRVEAERQAQARRDAESASLAKSRFLAAASHDLRQPLHALGLFASALESRAKDAESRELTARINQSIGALESLFSEVLEVSRLDAGAISAEMQPVALQALFDRIGNDFSAAAAEKGLALRFVPTARWVRSDPVLLERVLRNLVANAIRYTPSGGVLVGTRRRGGRLAVEVRDAGIGIAPEHQASVFDEFVQVGNTGHDRAQGLGLGLSIVRRLCALMGHPLTLASAPGRGSTFAVAMEPAAAPAAPQAQPALDAPLAGLRVAVVDDERDVRDAMGALLRGWGCEAVAVADAEELSSAPDLLVMDYRLRDGANGIDAARALRSRWGREVPTILVTGESSAAELARIRESGLPLLHKPVPPAKLKSLLAHLRPR